MRAGSGREAFLTLSEVGVETKKGSGVSGGGGGAWQPLKKRKREDSTTTEKGSDWRKEQFLREKRTTEEELQGNLRGNAILKKREGSKLRKKKTVGWVKSLGKRFWKSIDSTGGRLHQTQRKKR